MNYGPYLAAALFAAATTQNARDIVRTPVHPSHSVVSEAATPATPPPPSAPAPLAVGDLAPDFSYQSREYLWQNLHNMLEQGSVLLVFGATDEQLRSLERDQEELLHRGVIPVAIVGKREGEVWRVVRRHGLTYSLLSDPRAAIAEPFGALDPLTRAPRPLWFVVDRSGRVRGSGEGPSIPGNWSAVAASAQGLSDVQTAGAR